MSQLTYKEWDVKVLKEEYENGRTALVLVDATDGENITVATVNLPDDDLDEGEIFVKNYSENEGMVAWLEANNIAKPTGRRIQAGYVEIPVCKLI